MNTYDAMHKSPSIRERRSPFDYMDKTLYPFKWALPIHFMVGIGLVLSATLPDAYHALLAGLVLISPTILKSIFAYLGLYTDPLSQLVLKGRYQSKLSKSETVTNPDNGAEEDSFVVFLIGARPHRNIDGFFKWMGDAMETMIRELENDDTLGYIGAETFIGTTGSMTVQWWKDVESLNAWASSNMRSHKGPWAKLARMGAKSADYGFWHETYKVNAGNYETIYVNCPPMMFGNCRGVTLENAKESAAKRMRDMKK